MAFGAQHMRTIFHYTRSSMLHTPYPREQEPGSPCVRPGDERVGRYETRNHHLLPALHVVRCVVLPAEEEKAMDDGCTALGKVRGSLLCLGRGVKQTKSIELLVTKRGKP